MSKPSERTFTSRREREGVFSYVLEVKLNLQSKTGRSIPDKLRPRLNAVFEETTSQLEDTVARIFDEYETGPAD